MTTLDHTTITNDPFGFMAEMKDLSPRTDVSFKPWHQRTIALCAEGFSGKSFLIQSIPGCVVIDCDKAGPVNPHPRAMIFPDPTGSIDLPHPSLEGKRVTEFGFDYVRILVNRVCEWKKRNPDKPITVGFDTVKSLVEMRIRKWEDDTGKSFADANGMQVWPIITGQILGLIDQLAEHGVGVILAVHIATKSQKIKVGKEFQDVRVKVIDIPGSLYRDLIAKCDDGFRVFSVMKTVTRWMEVKDAKGKVVINPITNKPSRKAVGKTEKRFYGIAREADKGDNEEIVKFCQSRISGMVGLIEWEHGEMNPWETHVIPAYESAIERLLKGDLTAPHDGEEVDTLVDEEVTE